METVGSQEPPSDFCHFPLGELRCAIDHYLAIAYADAPLPEAIRKRLEWNPSLDPHTLLTSSPFEKVGKGTSGCPIVALRLGNSSYPHMKLQIQTWHSSKGFLLSVNTHDQVLAVDPSSADSLAAKRLQAENQRIKQEIENAWDAAGLPIFLNFLREYLGSNSNPVDRL